MDRRVRSFTQFFERLTGFAPYSWQTHVACQGFPDLLTVPTGLGKTEGAVLAWAWRILEDGSEPRHLVYCLPMRALVRQTVERLREYFSKLNGEIAVYQLMGGAVDDEWVSRPEALWVLVGTQDQLLSRALNRGYSMSRFEWPVHFGLLNNDCRWIVDEVQLMGPGLWTTAQLDWMRRERFGTLFDCPTTWMSATLGTEFLATVDRQKAGSHKARCLPSALIEQDRNPELLCRQSARKAIDLWSPGTGKNEKNLGAGSFFSSLARAVVAAHRDGTLSLVVCNTVEHAQRVFAALPDRPPKILLTSRFRKIDRGAHERQLLQFEERRRNALVQSGGDGQNNAAGGGVAGDPGLICVSTQVVEAGLDISAHRLWSEVSPWASVIQRLGRLNRDGRAQDAVARFWELPEGGSKKPGGRGRSSRGQEGLGPYSTEEIERARRLIRALIALKSRLADRPFAEVLECLAQEQSHELAEALRLRIEPMPRALDVHGLFSTEPDLYGGFTDVSTFVRGGDPDADLTVVWREWDGGVRSAPPVGNELDGPPLDPAEEGCPVPFYRLRQFLGNVGGRAWIWDEDSESWQEIKAEDLRPGMIVMVHAALGGYSQDLGWTGDPGHRLEKVLRAGPGRAVLDDQRTELGYWTDLSSHLTDARLQAEQLCGRLRLPEPLRAAVIAAAAYHDLGKAHPQWQGVVPVPADLAIGSGPWAKCPKVLGVDISGENHRQAVADFVQERWPSALPLPAEEGTLRGKRTLRLRWALDVTLSTEEFEEIRRLSGVQWVGYVPFRPRMRHEAATALALWHRYREGKASYPALAVYLAAAHHGKLRTVFRSLTANGGDAFGTPRQPPSIFFQACEWPMDFSVVKDGAEGAWTEEGFLLSGHGWTGLVADLLGPWHPGDESSAGVVPDGEPRRLGPFRLAYLEALVRIADRRASQAPSTCIRPSQVRET